MNDKNGKETVLELNDLTVRYGKMIAADAVTLSMKKGQVYALIGRNGAGKTSIIRCLLGERKANGGGTLLFGEDPWKKRKNIMARIGVVPEEPDAPPELTARQLITFCSSLYPSWDGRSVRERLERFKVPVNLPFQRLSKGQKGQLMLALALGALPELLILDDPTLGLDVVARKTFFEELVGELADRGASVFLTSHDLTGVESMADRIGIISKGKLLIDEPLETLKSRFRRITFGSDGPSIDESGTLAAMKPLGATSREWGTDAVVEKFSDEAFALFAKSPGVADAEASPMSLEEIFIALNGEGGELS